MKINHVDWCIVEIEDEKGYHSSVFLQGDGKWKCLRCQRYRCEHVWFVIQENPQLPPRPELTAEELALIFDE